MKTLQMTNQGIGGHVFIAYLGWIKVAETLLNPFGDDDEVSFLRTFK